MFARGGSSHNLDLSDSNKHSRTSLKSDTAVSKTILQSKQAARMRSLTAKEMQVVPPCGKKAVKKAARNSPRDFAWPLNVTTVVASS